MHENSLKNCRSNLALTFSTDFRENMLNYIEYYILHFKYPTDQNSVERSFRLVFYV